ncbi:hypothetical protein GOP47_0008068 [Adiantum capillus-veneris]|uniref:Uncharacterized protein n=1 Tax=Adiantum capillus-veneris TaxID=13818 RepID=A0A9D4UXV1_ADICA|nr:hypothetical protein GOP47_0008068 [Adiantum capillus-veneris]
MASRKKKAPAPEAAVGLKQKSLLFFFSKPSSHLPSERASPRLQGDEDDSVSSSLQDAGDSLRWSQLLTGWTPALDIESTFKQIGGDGGTPDHNNVDETEGESVIEQKTPIVLSGSPNGAGRSAESIYNNADDHYTHYVADKSDEREASSFHPCKRRRSSSQSWHPCDDGNNKDVKLELLEASAKCGQTTEPQKEFHMYQSRQDKVFAEDCNKPASSKRDSTNEGDTRSPVPSLPSTPVLQNNTTRPSAVEEDPALNLDEEYCENSKLCNSVCGRTMETTAEISNGNENVMNGCITLEVEEGTEDIKDRHGFSELKTVNGHDDVAAIDMLDKEIPSVLSPVATDARTNSSFLKLKRGSGHRVSAPEDFLEAPLTDYEKEREENILRNQHPSVLSPVATDARTNSSFPKRKRGSGHRVSAPEDFLEAPLTDYEKEREENILRNQHFMQKLGLTVSALTTSKEFTSHSVTKPKGKAIAKVRPPVLPVRRSSRLMQESVGAHMQDDGETAQIVACNASVEEEPLSYDDSSVLKYTCGDGVSNSASYPSHELVEHGVNKIIGFRPLDGVLQDKYLTRIYTMSARFVSQHQRTLLAAGGHQGRIAVFGTTSGMVRGVSVSMESDKNEFQEPLLSWKGSSCWISGVKFLSVQARESANLLLSSANDGNLVLWDINKQQKVQQLSEQLAGLPPLKVTEARGIHSNGIFSMHECCGHVATASKDATVGHSKVTDQEIRLDRSILGHHSGAIRGVNFRDASILADCGSDGLICILDLRMAEPCSLCIDTADPTGVNVVEWCPFQEHLLLSASKDPEISLHDIRNTKEPLYKLSGHVNPGVQRCSQIYRPTFVAQGGTIATPGQGSKALSLYSVDTGRAISRGHLGHDATMVMWTASCNESSSVLWVASRDISQLLPLWQTGG